jgi:hypothetical protein
MLLPPDVAPHCSATCWPFHVLPRTVQSLTRLTASFDCARLLRVHAWRPLKHTAAAAAGAGVGNANTTHRHQLTHAFLAAHSGAQCAPTRAPIGQLGGSWPSAFNLRCKAVQRRSAAAAAHLAWRLIEAMCARTPCKAPHPRHTTKHPPCSGALSSCCLLSCAAAWLASCACSQHM